MESDDQFEAVYFDGFVYITHPELVDELQQIKIREKEILEKLGWDNW